jgi:DNA-binding NarL/FixJ family response regulator
MPCRVFIADDVEAIRALWREFLEEDPGIEVVGEAPDGESAVGGVLATLPDVLLLDLSMPRVDGLEVIRTLQRDMPDVRIVVASGFTAARLAPLALELGATAYLEKGITAEALREAVLAAHDTVR